MVERTIDISILKSIHKYIEEIQKHYKIESVILFGSYASGNERKDSDIDLAIITNDLKNDIFDETVNFMMLRINIDLRIEPHLFYIKDYETRSMPLIEEIVRTGIKIL